MSGKLIAPCSLTNLMVSREGFSISGGCIDFPEPLASLVYHHKSELQFLQLEIIDAIGSDNLEEIGRHFEKLEKVIDLLIEHCAKKLIPHSRGGDSRCRCSNRH